MQDIFKEVSPQEWKNDVHSLWLLLKKHLVRFAAAVLCSVGVSALNGAIAWLVKPALNNLFVARNEMLLMVLPFGVFFIFTLRGALDFCNNFLMSSVGAKIVKFLRQETYKKLVSLPMSFYAEKSSGSLISRLLNDIGSLEGLIAFTAKNFFVQLTTVLFLSAVALLTQWDLALLSFTVIPLIVIVSDRLGKRMKKTASLTRRLIADVTKIIHETLAGIRVVKSFTMEDEMTARNDRATAEHYRNVMREVRINEFTGFLLDVAAGLGVALIMWYGSYLILRRNLSVGSFFSFIVAIVMIYTPLKRLSQVNNNFQMIRAALHRIKEVFLLVGETGGDVVWPDVEGHIVYQNVSFSYPESPEPVVKDISFEIRPGETIAIVGYSGAGKSTLADLLLGYWETYEGRILLDGVELRQYSLRDLRSHIGVVSQDIFLFDDTVSNNILFGRPGASQEDVVRAAKAAYAHDFIMDMQGRYDAMIGERGIKLSGGQKQRISLARAIIKDPKVLLLDEATSSLDSDSEQKIQRALGQFLQGRTTIVIAHRLSTVKGASKVLVMNRGRIVQQGTHEELFRDKGFYQELYNMQLAASGDK
jgi:subfamily B ATP-binding cassette protein MsbA